MCVAEVIVEGFVLESFLICVVWMIEAIWEVCLYYDRCSIMIFFVVRNDNDAI